MQLNEAGLAQPAGTRRTPDLIILIAIYNDWESVSILLKKLDATLSTRNLQAHVLLVDDASNEPAGSWMTFEDLTAIRRIQVLQVRRNVGNQRANAIAQREYLALIDEASISYCC